MIFKYNSLFIFSEKNSLFFFTEFCDHVNLIHGPNTSGKSTLMQSLVYVFGINDVKEHLEEILALDVFFRLDFSITTDGITEDLILIRDSGILYIKRDGRPTLVFNGVNGNSSFEHVKLKKYFHELFGFTLFLESKEEFKPAPIEAIFLPYYISQSVGWVYLRKSFSSLDYYRNFKDDFLDYYLGIETALDREKKKLLEAEILKLQKEQNFLTEMEQNDLSLQVMKISDEDFTARSLAYLEEYKKLQDEVAQAEKEYLVRCNELSFLNERKSVITRIKNNQIKQQPEDDNCPMCEQSLPNSFERVYIYLQENNDSIEQLKLVKEKIIDVQSTVNSLRGSIEKLKEKINLNYQIFKSYSEQNISMDSWMSTKANIKLDENIVNKIGKIAIDLKAKNDEMSGYKTEKQVLEERNRKSYAFKDMFEKSLVEMDVKALTDERFTSLYKIAAFPFQGVELHKTVMAYHFVLNKLISESPNIHRLPFVLDAVFKEDIDEENKDVIVNFIAKNRPKKTQLFLSISEKTDKPSQVARYASEYFKGNAKLILIGNGKDKRALLRPYNNEQPLLLEQSLNIINNVN
ncbi:hypothetical protein ABIB62_000009 [Mucilaginibacter sp. UYP25]|uniref:hypothetical protein n=1 Tax=Mucilaginibacter sp. UYP27 TaxID=1756391 RepID=UPI0033999399